MNIIKHHSPNLVGRDFVVSDLHGCYDLFLKGLSDIDFDNTKDRMFSVGDLIDRGPNSLECLRLIEYPWFFAIRGNHEDLMFSRTVGGALDYYDPNDWINNGGSWFLKTVYADLILVKKAAELPLISVVHKTDGTRVNIVHAEFPHNCTDQIIDDESFTKSQLIDLIWKRFRVTLFGKHEPSKKQRKQYNYIDSNLSPTYAGHTIFKDVKKLGKYTFIDTGAYASNKLTILEI
jgi:serine/threonine protein phosphatase 1